jgi:hypothetical protein
MAIDPPFNVAPLDSKAVVQVSGVELGFNRIRLSSAIPFRFDELRLGGTFLEVVPVAGQPALTQYQQWKLQLGLPMDSADDADPDGDGFGTLMEHALDLDPNLPNSGAVQVVHTAHEGGHRLELSFVWHRADVVYRVQASSDLATWVLVAQNPGSVGALVTVPDTDFLGSGPRFLRLVVARTP